MKIFGGFGGKHHHGREPKKAIPESEELSPAASAEPGEETPQAEPVHGPDEIPADAVYEEAASAETISEDASTEDTGVEETDAEETVRTPEEQAEIDEMIRRYQHKKRVRRWIILGVVIAALAAGFIIYKSTVKPPAIVQPSPPASTPAPATALPSSTPSGIPETTPEPTEIGRAHV